MRQDDRRMQQQAARTPPQAPARALSVPVMCAGLLLLVSCPAVGAQELKIGYISLAKAFDGYQRTKATEAILERKAKAKDEELRGRVDELKKMRESLELLNDQAREAKAREVEQRADDLQRLRASTAKDLSRERDKSAKAIFHDIQQAIDAYAKANGFAFILKKEDTILYAQTAYDVTDGVLKLLNSRAAAQ